MFNELFFKLNWLRTRCDQTLLEQISEQIRLKIADYFSSSTLPLRMEENLIVDLSYCILRHNRWIHLKLLQEITSDYILCQYSIDREAVENLTRDVLSQFAIDSSTESSIANTSQEDFIKHLVVSAMIARSGDDVFQFFGFGMKVFQRIVAAMEMVEQFENDCRPNSIRFVSEIDAMLISVINQFRQARETSPFLMELTRLELIFSELNEQQRQVLLRFSLLQVFELLYLSGVQNVLTGKQILGFFPDHERAHIIHLTTILESIGLLLLDSRAARFELIKYTPSRSALELTQNRFAKQFWDELLAESKTTPPKISKITQKIALFNVQYQDIICQQIPVEFGKTVIIDHGFEKGWQLTLKALKSLLNALINQSQSPKAVSLAKFLLSQKPISTWLQKELVQFLDSHEAPSESPKLDAPHGPEVCQDQTLQRDNLN